MHSMNEARRGAFDLMRCQSTRLRGKGWTSAGRTYFEGEVMGREMACTLERLGWLTRLSGRKGRPSQVTLTEIGMWILGGAS